MATDAATLLAEANCFQCYAANPYMLQLMELALVAQIVNNGGTGGAAVFYTFGNYGAGDSIPEDGSITTQGAWNLDTDHAYVNTAWPDTAAPTWAAH